MKPFVTYMGSLRVLTRERSARDWETEEQETLLNQLLISLPLTETQLMATYKDTIKLKLHGGIQSIKLFSKCRYLLQCNVVRKEYFALEFKWNDKLIYDHRLCKKSKIMT